MPSSTAASSPSDVRRPGGDHRPASLTTPVRLLTEDGGGGRGARTDPFPDDVSVKRDRSPRCRAATRSAAPVDRQPRSRAGSRVARPPSHVHARSPRARPGPTRARWGAPTCRPRSHVAAEAQRFSPREPASRRKKGDERTRPAWRARGRRDARRRSKPFFFSPLTVTTWKKKFCHGRLMRPRSAHRARPALTTEITSPPRRRRPPPSCRPHAAETRRPPAVTHRVPSPSTPWARRSPPVHARSHESGPRAPGGSRRRDRARAA
jgi:hypothetical protein